MVALILYMNNLRKQNQDLLGKRTTLLNDVAHWRVESQKIATEINRLRTEYQNLFNKECSSRETELTNFFGESKAMLEKDLRGEKENLRSILQQVSDWKVGSRSSVVNDHCKRHFLEGEKYDLPMGIPKKISTKAYRSL